MHTPEKLVTVTSMHGLKLIACHYCKWSPLREGHSKELGFRYKWLAGLVSRVRLYGKVRLQGLYGRVSL